MHTEILPLSPFMNYNSIRYQLLIFCSLQNNAVETTLQGKKNDVLYQTSNGAKRTSSFGRFDMRALLGRSVSALAQRSIENQAEPTRKLRGGVPVARSSFSWLQVKTSL